jgi:hypothetical protein
MSPSTYESDSHAQQIAKQLPHCPNLLTFTRCSELVDHKYSCQANQCDLQSTI